MRCRVITLSLEHEQDINIFYFFSFNLIYNNQEAVSDIDTSVEMIGEYC